MEFDPEETLGTYSAVGLLRLLRWAYLDWIKAKEQPLERELLTNIPFRSRNLNFCGCI
jgi:hypothetical protein